MESFVMAIPGAFTSKWGIDVWKQASQVAHHQGANVRPNDQTVTSPNDADLSMSVLPHHRSPPSRRTNHPLRLLPLARIIGIRTANGTPRDVTDVTVTRSIPRFFSVVPDDLYGHGDLAINDLCKRVRHLVSTCDNYSIFANKELWHKRARGCVETAASLVICADIDLEMFGDLRKLFHPLYESVGRYHLAPGSDGLFVARLDCLLLSTIFHGYGLDWKTVARKQTMAMTMTTTTRMHSRMPERSTIISRPRRNFVFIDCVGSSNPQKRERRKSR
ncbi:hypothetical protein H4582DRAFT_1948646 [Lactarius indigo]|nr:hypothetical protein H4582DRAFT_1948646 [Lactarius indigo]